MKQLPGWGTAALLAGLAVGACGQNGDPAAIQQKLNAQFQITTVTADRSEIVTAGSVVVLHKDGMMMYGITSPLAPSNSFKNGKIGQGWGGFGKDMAISLLTPGGGTAASYPQRKAVAEEKYWITGVQVQKDGILVQLYSDPFDDVRYYGNLKIVFPNKKAIPAMDAALQEVAEVLTVAPVENPAAQATPNQAVPAPVADASAPPVPAVPRYQEIAPPPPPPAPAPTVSVGEPKARVAADLGEPQRKAVVGTREIFYYSDPKMKVTFIGGRVSNVE